MRPHLFKLGIEGRFLGTGAKRADGGVDVGLSFPYKLRMAILRRVAVRMLNLGTATRQRLRQHEAILGEGVKIFPEGRVENLGRSASAVQIGDFTNVRGRLLTFPQGGKIEIGRYCYIGHNTEVWSQNGIKIGDRVLISHGVNINDGTAHSRDPEERHQHFRAILERGHPRTAEELPGVESAPVNIEDDVWINFGVTILKGVTIGARSIIAANSIVTKDVPPDSLYRMSISPIITPLAPR